MSARTSKLLKKFYTLNTPKPTRAGWRRFKKNYVKKPHHDKALLRAAASVNI